MGERFANKNKNIKLHNQRAASMFKTVPSEVNKSQVSFEYGKEKPANQI